MRYSAQDAEKEQEEFQWLEEKMKQESEAIEIPESLSPEKMLEKLKQLNRQEAIEESYLDHNIQNENQNQKHQFLKNGKRILIAVATFALVAGVSWKVGKIAHFSSKDEDCSAIESVECEDVLSEKVECRDGTYHYEGKANQVIIQKDNQEVAQLTLEQDVKYILRYARILICITSDGETTSICTFSVDDFEQVEHPHMTGTVSIEASYEDFYMEGSTLSIITGEGKEETFDIREIQGE